MTKRSSGCCYWTEVNEHDGVVVTVLKYITPSGKSGEVVVGTSIAVESVQDTAPRLRFRFEEDSG